MQGVANGLKNDNEYLIKNQEQMKASMVANNNNISKFSTNLDSDVINQQLNQLLHETSNVNKLLFNNKNKHIV